jgi:glycosyltransferase involved in cell wall biosynthesis
MDICVLNPYFYPYFGGTEKVLLEIYTRLAKNNNVTVITSDIGSKPGEETFNGIHIIRLKSRQHNFVRLPLPLTIMDGLNEAITRVDAEIYHINNRYQYFRSTVNTIKKRVGKNLALTIHNSLPVGIDPITDFGGLAYDVIWGRRIMREANIITAVSKNALEITVPKTFQNKSIVIHNGIDYTKFRPAKNEYKTEKIKNFLGFGEGINIISNGRLTTQKGHKYLINAIMQLKSRGTKANLLIIGRGPLESKLRELVKRLRIENHVRIINGIREEDLPYYYNSSDIFVFPSLYEPAGMAMLEALACGIPTIATKIGGIPETLGEYGEYIKIRDKNDIADKVLKVYSELKRYENLALECREKVIKKQHDWDNIAKEYENAFEQTLRA